MSFETVFNCAFRFFHRVHINIYTYVIFYDNESEIATAGGHNSEYFFWCVCTKMSLSKRINADRDGEGPKYIVVKQHLGAATRISVNIVIILLPTIVLVLLNNPTTAFRLDRLSGDKKKNRTIYVVIRFDVTLFVRFFFGDINAVVSALRTSSSRVFHTL